MKLLCTLLMLMSFYTGFSQSEGAISGLWISEDGTQVVEVFEQNQLYFGRLKIIEPENSFLNDSQNKESSLRSRPLLEAVIWSDFIKQENGKFKSGKIYNFKNGNTYNGRMQVKDDVLHLTGHYGIFFFLGKTQKWMRYKD